MTDERDEILRRVVALRDHGRAGTGGDTFFKCADDAEALLNQLRRAGDPTDPTVLENTAPEGWLVSECSDGVLRIQKYDDDPHSTFDSDADTLAYVHSRASQGSEIHRLAIHITALGHADPAPINHLVYPIREPLKLPCGMQGKLWLVDYYGATRCAEAKVVPVESFKQAVDANDNITDDQTIVLADDLNDARSAASERRKGEAGTQMKYVADPDDDQYGFIYITRDRPRNPDAGRDDLRSIVRRVVAAVRAIDDKLNDPHGDGTGDGAQSPTGDSYNELWDCLGPLFTIAEAE
jgi:hypothetical protein